MKVKIKKLSKEAVIPRYAKRWDAGMDLVATKILSNEIDEIEYGTGLSIEIPEGYVGLIFPRSSIKKYDLFLSNSIGVIDSGYRGEMKFTFKKSNPGMYGEEYKIGDRIGQLIILPYPQIEFEEVDELSFSERGKDGFGSTGK